MAKRQDLAVVLRFNAETGKLEGQVRNVEKLLRQAADAGETAGRKMGDGFTRAERDARGLSARLDSMRNLAAGLFASLATGAALNKIVETKRQFDVLNASLETVTGSASAAQQAFSLIQQFASQTPYQLAEVTQAFVKMKALGLDASMEALRSYGNTAAAMGKSLGQFIEAVADAATGEFERLKEFGIKARQEGEKVTFTFRGVSTTVGNSAEEIVAYLQKIGNTDFAGAMERRMATLDGAISNLADSWENLFITIGNSGVGNLIADSVRLATATINDLNAILKALSTTAAETTGEMGALKVIQEGLAIVFETVAVVGANVKYVIEQIGRDIGGLAAAAAAVLRGNFAQARDIFSMMGEDAEAARKEVDATTALILNARKEALATQGAQQAVAQGAPAVVRALGGSSDAAKQFADQLENLRNKINGQDAGIDADFYKNMELLRDGYNKGKLSLEEYMALAERYIKQQKFYQDQVKESAAAEEERRKAVERAAEEHARAVQSAEEMVEQIQFETEALKMTNTEREIAIKLRDLERKGIKAGSAEYEEYARRIRDAVIGKEAIEASIEQQRRAREEWQRVWDDVSRGFVDALMEGGKSVKEYLVKLFRTMVLRPILQPIVGGVVGALGLGGMSSAFAAEPGSLGAALGLSNAVSAIKGIYNTVIGGFSALGDSVAFAAQDIGAWLVQNTTGILNSAGASIMQAAGTLGTAASYLGGIGAGIGIGNLISGKYAAFGNANISNIGGTAIGAIFGGPLGAAIGGAIGGLINRAFGRGKEKVIDTGIRGTFSASGADVVGYTKTKRSGGWFSSAKYRTYTNAIAPELESLLDAALVSTANATKRYASVIGLSAEAVDGYSKAIEISLNGLSAEEQQRKIAETLSAFGEEMIATLYPAIREFQKNGEMLGETLSRLGGSLLAVNDAIDLLGGNLLEASLASGDLANKIIEAFGGLDQFGSAVQTYYANFYTEQERLAEAIESMEEAFADLGLKMPKTKEEFRALVEAQDVTTESGRKTLAALLSLSGAFAEIANASRAVDSEFEALQERLLRLQGDTAALRARERAALDERNRALFDRITALEDANSAAEAAKSAAEAALNALAESVRAEQDRLQAQFERESDILNDRIRAISDVIATLDNAIRSVRGSIETTSIASQTAARLTLQSVLTAVQGGADITGFEPVIEQASATLTRNDPNLYQTREQFVRAQAQAAGLLEELNKAGGKQLTLAELQLKALKDGFAAEVARLDDLVTQAEKQINALLGIDESVLSVEAAVKAVNTAIGQLAVAVNGLASAATAQRTAPPVESLSSPSAAAAAGYITSPVNSNGSRTGVGDSGYRLVATATGATLYFPGGGSHEVSGANAAQLLTQTYGLQPGGLNGTLIRTRAQGGYTPPGLTLVGEEGPELINFKNPGMVYTNRQTSEILGNREVVAELQALRAEMIELRVQARRTADAVNGNPEAPMLVETVA